VLLPKGILVGGRNPPHPAAAAATFLVVAAFKVLSEMTKTVFSQLQLPLRERVVAVVFSWSGQWSKTLTNALPVPFR
jgi:hypothetical protein